MTKESARWIRVDEAKPDFGKTVLVYCKIYGIFMASYESIDGTKYGNWRDCSSGDLGILPPIYWTPIPALPESTRI